MECVSVSVSRACLPIEPQYLLIDEPSNGLDPRGRQWLQELLLELSRDGHSILIATHDLEMVRRIADRVVTMQSGRMTEETSLGEYVNHYDGCRIEILCNSPSEVAARLTAVAVGENLQTYDNRVCVSGTTIEEVVDCIAGLDIEIGSISYDLVQLQVSQIG